MGSRTFVKTEPRDGAWGIDLGLKSLRIAHLALDSQGALEIDLLQRVTYPTTGGAAASWSDQVHAALSTFAEQHDLGAEPIAASVPEFWSLITYSQVPSLTDERIHDLVSYEARIQIPLPLEEIVWDYQCFPPVEALPEGELGMALLALVAMKTEYLDGLVLAFDRLKCPLEIVQVRSMATANMARHDGVAGPEQGIVGILDIGLDESWLTVINQSRVLRRSVSTSAAAVSAAFAESLKLTPQQADAVRRQLAPETLTPTVLEALRKPYSTLSESAHQAIGLCLKNAHCDSLLIVGEGGRLPLIDRVLNRRLGCPVKPFDVFSNLALSDTLAGKKTSRKGLAAFTPACGLALQALGQAYWQLNLLHVDEKVEGATPPSGKFFSWLGKRRQSG
jgi:type IV pilus assembly protein PilM